MPFNNATEVSMNSKGNNPYIRMTVKEMADGPSRIMFTMNKLGKDLYFPDLVVGDKVLVQYGTGDDVGKCLIAANPNGNSSLRSFSKSAFSVNVLAWSPFVNAKFPAKGCKVLLSKNNSAVFLIPHSI